MVDGVSGAVAFSVNGNGYVCGGSGSSGCNLPNTLFVFDLASGYWDTVPNADFPGTTSNSAVAFVIGSKAYVGLGWDNSNNPLTDFYAFDANTQAWSPITAFPGHGRGEAIAFSICDYGFVGLGYDLPPGSTDYQDIYSYDPATNSWNAQLSYLVQLISDLSRF